MVLEIIVTTLLILCVIMTCIPTLPGLPLMFFITLVYGIVDKFETMQPWHLAVFGGITLLSIAIDALSGVLGAKLGGASRKALLAGIGGLVVGLLLFPPFGAFIGLFLGVFIAEAAQFKDFMQAFKKASVSLAAAAAGTIMNVFLATAFLVTYLIIAF